jgi:hypothetical protein
MVAIPETSIEAHTDQNQMAGGGESALLPDDIDSWYVSQGPNDSTN